jgi:hypothetical protein
LTQEKELAVRRPWLTAFIVCADSRRPTACFRFVVAALLLGFRSLRSLHHIFLRLGLLRSPFSPQKNVRNTPPLDDMNLLETFLRKTARRPGALRKRKTTFLDIA